MATTYINSTSDASYPGFTEIGHTPDGESVFTYLADVGRSANTANGNGVGGFSVYDGQIVTPPVAETTPEVAEVPELDPTEYPTVEETPAPEVAPEPVQPPVEPAPAQETVEPTPQPVV